MKAKFVIIGGGVAGLCAAIRLTELGEAPFLIESGSYPAHKVCGEFLSPECIGYLNAWEIFPVLLDEVILRSLKRSQALSLPSPAGGLSHGQLDPKLAHYASTAGAHIQTNTQVVSFQPKKKFSDEHQVVLSNGEVIEAQNVIVAAGRFLNFLGKPPAMKYLGFKAHFKDIAFDAHRLNMFLLSHGYLGVSPIEDGKFNVAGLVELKSFEGMKPLECIKEVILRNPQLDHLLSKGENLFGEWMISYVPAFGFKSTPPWPDAYFIGDAALTIPPASGGGLSMAICGGRLAAEYSVKRRPQDFKAIWNKRCSSQLFWAKILHNCMLKPYYIDPLMGIASTCPYIAKKLFLLTRQRAEEN